MRVAPLLAPASDWAAFLAGELGIDQYAAIRADERTARLERRLDRTLARRKPGPKPGDDRPGAGHTDLN